MLEHESERVTLRSDQGHGGDLVQAVGLFATYQWYPTLPCTGHTVRCGTTIYFADVYTEVFVNHDIDLRVG